VAEIIGHQTLIYHGICPYDKAVVFWQ